MKHCPLVSVEVPIYLQQHGIVTASFFLVKLEYFLFLTPGETHSYINIKFSYVGNLNDCWYLSNNGVQISLIWKFSAYVQYCMKLILTSYSSYWEPWFNAESREVTWMCLFLHIWFQHTVSMTSAEGFNVMFLSLPRISFPQSQAGSFLKPWMYLVNLEVRILNTAIYFVAVVMPCAYSGKCISQSGEKDISGVWKGFVSGWSIGLVARLDFWKYSVRFLILAQCKLLEIKWNIKRMKTFFRACTFQTDTTVKSPQTSRHQEHITSV